MNNENVHARGGDWAFPTNRQLDLMRMFKKFHDKNGLPPTIRDMCAMMGWRSNNACAQHVNGLFLKGYMGRRAMLARGLYLTELGLSALENGLTRVTNHDD